MSSPSPPKPPCTPQPTIMAPSGKTHVLLLLVELSLVLVVMATVVGWSEAHPMDREYIDPLQLSTFKGYKYDYSLGSNGVYKFLYSLPTSSRSEQRDENGDVSGSYSFVAPEGDEFDFKYEADKRGFRVESDALPISPKDTDEVRKAKEVFFEAYKKALERVSSSESEYNNHGEEEEDDDDDDSDEDSEESDEDSDEDDDEESSEESSEEDDDDSDEDDEEEEEEGPRAAVKTKRLPTSNFARTPYRPKSVDSKKRGSSTFKRPIFISSLPPKRTSTRPTTGSYGSKVPSRKDYYYAKK